MVGERVRRCFLFYTLGPACARQLCIYYLDFDCHYLSTVLSRTTKDPLNFASIVYSFPRPDVSCCDVSFTYSRESSLRHRNVLPNVGTVRWRRGNTPARGSCRRSKHDSRGHCPGSSFNRDVHWVEGTSGGTHRSHLPCRGDHNLHLRSNVPERVVRRYRHHRQK